MIFSSDTTGLEKGAKTAKQSIKDFDSTVGSATDSLARMFGVDTAAVEKMTSSLRGMGETMKDSANKGVASFGKMLSSINGVTAAVAGIGIAAAVASFKALNTQAEYFKSTIEGANIEMATAAYVRAYSAAMNDMNKATGKSVAEFEAGFKEAWGRLKANISQGFVNAITGNKSTAQTIAGALIPGGSLLFGASKEQREQAKQVAQEVKDLTIQLDDAQDSLKLKAGEWEQIEARIANLKLEMVDTDKTIAERQAANAEAQRLTTERAAEEKAIRDEIVRLQGLINDATSSAEEDVFLLAQYEAEAARVELQRAAALKSLQKTQTALTKEAGKEAEERRKAAEALAAQAKAMADSKAALAATDLSTSGGLAALLPKGITGPDGAIEVKFRPVLDEDATLDLTNELVNLAASMSSAIGGLVGDLASGGDAWGNFKNAALSAFADMAISVGKLAMATGAATAGIKAALESLNPYVAIAAGAALIALGSAVKAGLSNAAAGNYAAAASPVATSSFSSRSPSDAWNTNALTVRVEGKLVADGDQLTAVINNTNNRNSHTT